MVVRVIQIARLLIILASRHRSLAVENLALRQQVAVYHRTRPKPTVRWSDRLFWVGLRLAWPDWKSASQLDVEVCLRTRSTGISRTEFDRLHGRWPTRLGERRFLAELIALENRLSRGYGDGQRTYSQEILQTSAYEDGDESLETAPLRSAIGVGVSELHINHLPGVARRCQERALHGQVTDQRCEADSWLPLGSR